MLLAGWGPGTVGGRSTVENITHFLEGGLGQVGSGLFTKF